MHKLSIFAALKQGWAHFKTRGWYLFGLTAAVIALAVLASGEASAAALAYIIFGGYLALLLKHASKQEVKFDDLFDIDRRWIYFAFGALIKGVLIMLGFLCFIVPGVYLAIRWMFSELYIIDKGMKPLEALKASSELTAGYRWKLFGYAVLVVCLFAVSILFLVVGFFVAVAVINLTTIALFWRLQEIQFLKQQEQS